MKTAFALAFLPISALLTSCASSTHPVMVDEVGPPPIQRQTTGSRGAVLVYTAIDANVDFNDLAYVHHRYSDYKILSLGGKLLAVVDNNYGRVMRVPKELELPAGEYRIAAEANAYRAVTVPVLIKPNQLTTVYLDSTASSSGEGRFFGTDPVRLPDGEIVGWRVKKE